MSGLAITTSRIPFTGSVYVNNLNTYPAFDTTLIMNGKLDSLVLRQITSKTTPEQFNELMNQNPDYRLDQYDERLERMETILSITLKLKNLPLLRCILQLRPSLTKLVCCGRSPLSFLSTIDDPEFVLEAAKLIVPNVDVNVRCKGLLPLHYFALQEKFKEITKLLLLNRAVTIRWNPHQQRGVSLIESTKQKKNIKNALQELHVEIPIIEWIRDDETGVLSQIVKDVRIIICRYLFPII